MLFLVILISKNVPDLATVHKFRYFNMFYTQFSILIFGLNISYLLFTDGQ